MKTFAIITWFVAGITTMLLYEQVPLFIYFLCWITLMTFMVTMSMDDARKKSETRHHRRPDPEHDKRGQALAIFVVQPHRPQCYGQLHVCHAQLNTDELIPDEWCTGCILEYLQQPAKEV